MKMINYYLLHGTIWFTFQIFHHPQYTMAQGQTGKVEKIEKLSNTLK